MSHPEDRTDRAETLHLQQAVVGRDWARTRTVLPNVSANQLNYRTLIKRLDYSLQKSEKHREASVHEPTLGNSLVTALWKSTTFVGQVRFTNIPRSRNSIVPKHVSNSQDGRDSYRRIHPRETWPRGNLGSFNSTCHNCGKVGCRWYRCKEPMDMPRVIRNGMAMTRHPSSGRSLSGVNLTEAIDDLANEMMETMMVSDFTVADVPDNVIPESISADLDEDLLKETSFTTGVQFDILEDDETDLNQPSF